MDRVVALHAMVFRRSDTDIVFGDFDFPYGGDYSNPFPTNSFWSRTPLPGNHPLYISMRIFTSDGLAPQEAEWSPPALLVRHGYKGDTGATGGDGLDGYHGLDGPIGNPGGDGIDGAGGVTGDSITWAGDAIAHPLNPTQGMAYYNTLLRKSFVFFDNAWYQMTVDGIDGQNGNHSAIINLYKKTNSTTIAPSNFTGTFTYTYATAALTGGTLNGWSQSLPSTSPGEYIWVRQASAVGTESTDVIEDTEFSGAVVISGIGTNGVDGLDGTSVVLKGSVDLIIDLPAGATAGDLYIVLEDGNGYVSDGLNGWVSVGVIQGPQGQTGLSVQVVYHSASMTGSAPTLPTTALGTDNGWVTDAATDSVWMSVKVDDGTGTIWGAPIRLAGVDGLDGLNSATVQLYKKSSSNLVSPTLPTGTFTYTFATGLLSGGVLGKWTQKMSSLLPGEYAWLIQATASSTAATDTIPVAEFSAPVTVSGVGINGSPIVWKGELAEPPINAQTNWVYRDSDNGFIYIYANNAWELMVLDGNDGAAGADGINGWSVYITYHDASPDGAAPAIPTNVTGSNNGWHTAATSAASWMSQKVDNGSTANWGAAIRIRGTTGTPGTDYTADPTVPPAPGLVVVTPYYAKIQIEWPATTSLHVAQAQIFRHTSDVRGSAVCIGTTPGNFFIDSPPDLSAAVQYWYWVRFISPSGIIGPDNAVSGTVGTTANDPSYLLEVLTGKLGYGQFDVTQGVFPIRTVTSLPLAVPDFNWPLTCRVFLTTNKLIYKCTGIAPTGWTLEADQANIRAEFGVGVLTAGAVLADSIGANEVITNSANIKNAIITSAKIASLAADKIAAGNIAVALNLTAGGIVKSTNYVANATGWKIDSTGFAEFQNIKARGDIEATSIKANSVNIIDTLNLKGQAVTFPVAVSRYTRETITGPAGQAGAARTAASLTQVLMTNTGVNTIIIVNIKVSNIGRNLYLEGESSLCSISLLCNSTECLNIALTSNGGADGWMGVNGRTLLFTPPAGSNIYSIRVNYLTTYYAPDYLIFDGYIDAFDMVILEAKR